MMVACLMRGRGEERNEVVGYLELVLPRLSGWRRIK